MPVPGAGRAGSLARYSVHGRGIAMAVRGAGVSGTGERREPGAAPERTPRAARPPTPAQCALQMLPSVACRRNLQIPLNLRRFIEANA